jgi:hypothetical protein
MLAHPPIRVLLQRGASAFVHAERGAPCPAVRLPAGSERTAAAAGPGRRRLPHGARCGRAGGRFQRSLGARLAVASVMGRGTSPVRLPRAAARPEHASPGRHDEAARSVRLLSLEAWSRCAAAGDRRRHGKPATPAPGEGGTGPRPARRCRCPARH